MDFRKYFICGALSIVILCLPLRVSPDQGERPDKGGFQGKIVFSSYVQGAWQLWSIHPDGGNLSQLTHGSEDLDYPAWSTDGKRLAYADSEGMIWVMDVGEVPRRLPYLPKNCSHPAWSPDGGRIALVCYTFRDRKEDSDIWMADLKKEKAWKLMAQSGIQKYPAWSPDGSTIAYSNGYRRSADKVIEALWLVGREGKNPRSLISNNGSNIQPAWSPNGEKIAFASDQKGNMDIWVVDRDGGNARQLTHSKSYDGDPTWSPGGSRLSFVSTRSGRIGIWIMDNDGGNPHQLPGPLEGKAKGKDPHWSSR